MQVGRPQTSTWKTSANCARSSIVEGQSSLRSNPKANVSLSFFLSFFLSSFLCGRGWGKYEVGCTRKAELRMWQHFQEYQPCNEMLLCQCTQIESGVDFFLPVLHNPVVFAGLCVVTVAHYGQTMSSSIARALLSTAGHGVHTYNRHIRYG